MRPGRVGATGTSEGLSSESPADWRFARRKQWIAGLAPRESNPGVSKLWCGIATTSGVCRHFARPSNGSSGLMTSRSRRPARPWRPSFRSRGPDQPVSRTAWVLFALLLAPIVLFAADHARRHMRWSNWHEELEHASSVNWPPWQASWHPLPGGMVASEGLRGAYSFAALNRDRLRFIPCYCGCVREGHGSVLDCFVKASSAGRPVWTDHAFKCPVCVSIVREVALMTNLGTSLPTIRESIDRYHGRLLRAPTTTPMPR